MRFLPTDVGGFPQRIYERIYCLREDANNRLKELKWAIGLDRTSCHCFDANPFRVLLAATHALPQELRWQARGTDLRPCPRAPRSRDFLLKIAVWVKSTVRRVVLHLPQAAPAQAEWQRITRRLVREGPALAGA